MASPEPPPPPGDKPPPSLFPSDKKDELSSKRSRDENPRRGYATNRRGDGKKSRTSSGSDYYGRGSSYSYYSTDSRGDYHGGGREDEDWKCLECRTWNYPQDHSCIRCGAPSNNRRDRERHSARNHDGRSGGHSDSRGDNERKDFATVLNDLRKSVDEFGREARPKEIPPKKKWPPCFQENGAAYVFDARSGFFYEAATDFFFDPKTKLYFGNKTHLYYQYCADVDPPFQELPDQKVATGGDESKGMNVEAVASEAAEAKPVEKKKKIAISLKTKTLPSGKDGGSKTTNGSSKASKEAVSKPKAAAPTVQTRVHKKHAAHMDMWSERGKETSTEDGSSGTQKNKDAPKLTEQSNETVAKTAKGQPICLLCKRKFANLDKLRQHEKLSALHKENMAKKEAAKKEAAKAKKESSVEYRDRAKERRVMYGPESSLLPQGQSGILVEEAQHTEIVRPEENLGESNIGNQMLQKLGWKPDADGSSGRGSLDKTIRKDWQRIESLAGSGHGAGRNRGGGVGS